MSSKSKSGSFSPIAIVGRACVLPGALNPEELWTAVREGRDLVTSAPADRWRIRPSRILTTAEEAAPDRTWCDRGGYVTGFEDIFSPKGFEIPEEEVASFDPLVHWVLHTGRAAYSESKFTGDRARVGAVLGNLSYPSSSMSAHAERTWLDRLAPKLGANIAKQLKVPSSHAKNRFMSGLPAHTLAQALGLKGEAYALDAACASSLYAIKLACDALQDGRADLMLAGAVNRADDLFLHVGFAALKAISETGQSRPFHRDADGLLPAEGACMFALRRLEDAEHDGEKILGVIRGVGLSNDGRDRGLLVPSQSGQRRAMREALDVSGLSATEIDFVECHATGTAVGDATEIASLKDVYGERDCALPIGSFKANCGHLITAAGGAGLLKMLSAMEHQSMPATPHVDSLHPDFEGSSLEVLSNARPWSSMGPRRAAVSAFGFGGNNAHLLVEEYRSDTAGSESPAEGHAEPLAQVAVVSVGARIADGESAHDFEQSLFQGSSRVRARGESRSGHAQDVRIALKGLRFPPADLGESIPQQLLLLESAREAVEGITLPAERTSVLMGMQCDPEIARHGARWRLIEWAQELEGDAEWLKNAREGFVPLLGAPGVIGAMPNIVANRINSQFGLEGPSFALSSEELSGIRALRIAQRALGRGDIDAALVGAVDICSEEVHESAAKDMLSEPKQLAGDAAVVLVLKRREDAERDGDQILALVSGPDEKCDEPPHLSLNEESLIEQFGHAHAASGLVHLLAGVACCARGEAPAQWSQGRDEDSSPFRTEITVKALGAQQASVSVIAPGDLRTPAFSVPSAAPGPSLTLEAHRAPPQLSALGETQTTRPRLLPDAPLLPPVLKTPLASDPQVPPEKPTTAWPTPPPVQPSPSPTVGSSGISQEGNALTVQAPPAALAQHLEIQRALSTAHQGYLEQQSRLHSHFLQMRARVASSWLSNPSVPSQLTVPATGAALDAPSTGAHSVERIQSLPPQPAPAHGAAEEAPTIGSDVRGPTFSRQDLEVHASGKISTIFGQEFEHQDAHSIQVRMPEPPLLLADRIVGIDAEKDSMGLGTVWSETDVREDTWFVHRGRVPAGILIECGQADLFLISYLGIDRLNQGKRAYRLLGCELTYHGSAPGVGDTLHYDIHIDSHAAQGDVRLFFFHSDCHAGERAIMSVRNGQAGFFTEEELADSAGVLWSPEDETLRENPRLDAPYCLTKFTDFDETQIRAFAQGDLYGCFGAGFERGQTHTDSPAIQDGDLNFIDRIESLDPKGGPWKRGYARAITDIHPDDWFFDGHFKNDPCMPGTLMFEGCLQLMGFYLAALGHTLERDGWRFEPVPEVKYQLHCRGQVVPSSKQLVCEIFVEEVWDGPEPTVFAHLLGTVDGKKAFHARHVGVRLVPDWPLASRPDLLRDHIEPKPVASADGFDFDYASLLSCAWGKPSLAFGSMYRPFDGTRRVARLPGPPYHFMSRVTRTTGGIGNFEAGAEVEIEYDVPTDAWYFEENGCALMPFAVLLEVALQPCGWLASFVGSALTSENDLSFRNLDGKGRVHKQLDRNVGTVRTVSKLTNVSQSGDMIIQSFDVACYAGDECVYELKTVFGFFPAEALANQIGLPTTDTQREDLTRPSDFLVDLTQRPSRYCEKDLRLARPMLCMIDRVTAFEPTGGENRLGRLRCEKDVDSSEWFFKAHFFQDPVQPGSLGLEVMLQLLQFYMLETGMGEPGMHFEAIESSQEMAWKYRGQVVPENRLISTTLEVTETGENERGKFARANASLWVDGKRIYEAVGLGMRVINSRP